MNNENRKTSELEENDLKDVSGGMTITFDTENSKDVEAVKTLLGANTSAHHTQSQGSSVPTAPPPPPPPPASGPPPVPAGGPQPFNYGVKQSDLQGWFKKKGKPIP